MGQNDLVSVVVPIYNGEKYIDTFLYGRGGVLRQTYKNIEVILVPNNCSDHSVEKCESRAADDPRIKVFVNGEKGTSLARKRGILESKGRYILFMDCDDRYIDDEAIRHMYEAIRQDGTEICQFGHYVDYGIPFYKKAPLYPFRESRIFTREELLAGPILGAALGRGGTFDGSVWSKIYKAEVLKDAARCVRAPLTQQEDLHLNALAFSSDVVRSVSCRKEAYYVYKVGIGVSSKDDALITLLRDYRFIKPDVYSRMQGIPVRQDFNLRLWSEAVYCYRSFINEQLSKGRDEQKILDFIREIEDFNYIKMAKEFYKTYSGEERNDYIDFLCSDYTPEEYLAYCKKTMPVATAGQKIKGFVKRIIK